MAETTLFDRILDNSIPSHKVAEGENWYAFLDIFPRREGHTLVIPKQSVQRLSQLTNEMRTSLFEGVVSVQRELSKQFETDDNTECIHDEPLAGQVVPHVHVHVIPRNSGDGGSTLHAMWPQAPSPTHEPDHKAFAMLSSLLQEVNL